MNAVDGAPEVHTEAPFPILVSPGAGRSLQPDAGVVDEHLHSTELLLDLIGGAFPTVAVHDVMLDRMQTRIVGRELLERIPDVLVVEVADHDLHACLVEHARDSEADAAGATGDIGNLAFDISDLRSLRSADVGCRRGLRHTCRGGLSRRLACPDAKQASRSRRHAAQDLPPAQSLLVHTAPQ